MQILKYCSVHAGFETGCVTGCRPWPQRGAQLRNLHGQARLADFATIQGPAGLRLKAKLQVKVAGNIDGNCYRSRSAMSSPR
jgi:hypothetical protein